jgi:hypothetical protein
MRYVVLLVMCLLSACATSSVELPEETTAAPLSSVNFGISLNRASLTSHDFEKYKLLPAGLFVECGTFYRGRPETTSQAIEQVGVESIEEARRLARLIIESYSSNPTEAIDPPGDSSDLADPGMLTLRASDGAKKIELRTSVDWVEQKRGSFAALVNEFTQVVRGLTPEPLCGQHAFYGIGRSSRSAG